MDFPVVYAVKHKNFDIRMASRSGGIFTAISDEILNKNGIVYGCVLNEELKAAHIRVETKEGRDLMHGSKYVQSDMSDMFKRVREDLEDGRKVLFSGTSCQIAGLKAFLSKDYGEQLFCLDILCHGVPSPLVWKKYVAWQEEKNGGVCIGADFRNKKDFGWAAHVETLKIKQSDDQIKTVHSRVYTNMFYSHKVLRECCYKCPYKSIIHPGDMTIGDFWRVNNAVPDFDDDCGVSLVLINSEYAQRLFDAAKKKLNFSPCRIEDSMQIPLKHPFKRPEGRSEFWKDLRARPFDEIAVEYGNYTPEAEQRLARIAAQHKTPVIKEEGFAHRLYEGLKNRVKRT
jgi:coenzyme F420-reducing hydrogenase beta subunit